MLVVAQSSFVATLLKTFFICSRKKLKSHTLFSFSGKARKSKGKARKMGFALGQPSLKNFYNFSRKETATRATKAGTRGRKRIHSPTHPLKG